MSCGKLTPISTIQRGDIHSFIHKIVKIASFLGIFSRNYLVQKNYICLNYKQM
jgi:hypothetical protein